MAEERKADKLAGKGSTADTVKTTRDTKQTRLNQIMNEIDTGTARKQIK